MDARRYFAPRTSSLCVLCDGPSFFFVQKPRENPGRSIDKKKKERHEMRGRCPRSLRWSGFATLAGWGLGIGGSGQGYRLMAVPCVAWCLLACSSLFPCARALTRWSCAAAAAAAAVLFLNPSFGVGFLAFNNGFPVSTMAWRQSNNKRSAGWFVVKVVVSRLAKVVSICKDEIQK